MGTIIMARHRAAGMQRANSARGNWRSRTRGSANTTQLRYAAAVLSAYAALVHNWAFPAHLWEWWGYGLFFLVSAAAQGFYSGLLLFWPSRAVFLAGVAGNAAILALYGVTRTVGIPFFGPHVGRVEAVRAPDLAVAIVELALVFVLTWLVRSRSGGAPASHLQ